jgi:hypothetical protein
MTMVHDKKTGRLRKVDPLKSRIAKRAAASRRGKRVSSAVRAKMSKSAKRVAKTGKTKFGRRAIAA